MDLKIIFWGVRGSKPTPRKDTMLFGGNTSCVQVEVEGRNLIFDGGTGITELGKNMILEECKEADIFFSHLHWDHIQGLPFFTPLYIRGNNFRLYGEDKKGSSFQEVICKQMKPPYFPVTMKEMKSNYEFISINSNEEINLGEGIKVKTFALKHTDGCISYRVEKGDSVIIYCTDTEPMEEVEEEFIEFLKGADVLIYDTQYTNIEYYGSDKIKGKEEWGHSTWEEGIRLCKKANIDYLVLYHHKEDRNDEEQKKIEDMAKKEFENTVAAREGMIITVGGSKFEKVAINYPY